MLKQFVHLLVGPLAYAWVVSRVRRDGELAFPSDPPLTHGSGPDADRVLLLGGLIVRGMGVASFDLALSGHLARQLAARTGRGTDIDTRGIDRFDTFTAAQALKRENLARFDVVVLMLGIAEVVSLRPLGTYRRDIDRLLGEIERMPLPRPPILIAGVSHFADGLDVPGFVAEWMHRRVERQNAVTREACERSRAAQYVPFAPARSGIRYGRDATAIYESWATALVPALDRALAVRGPGSSPRSDAPDESERQRALDELSVDPGHDARVDRIVQMAREMLGVDAAALNVIDRDRQWSKATAGFEARDVPRGQAICNTTIQTPGVHVVEDLDQAPELRGSPFLEEEDHVRFYAGYPLEAPGGERIGALCVMHREPRTFGPRDTAVLRDLALRAQALLWDRA